MKQSKQFDFSNAYSKAQSLSKNDLAKRKMELSASHGKLSLEITNNKNGYRIVFSKELSDKLKLVDTVSLLPIEDTRQLIMGTKLPFEAAEEYELHEGKNGRKIVYKKGLVLLLSAILCINYDSKTSHTFYDICVDDYEGTPVAILTVDDDSAGMAVPLDSSDLVTEA